MWRCHTTIRQDGTVHVWPEDDLIEHDLDGPCVCGAAREWITANSVLVTHHSLDGRELSEADHG